MKSFNILDKWIVKWRQYLQDYNISFDHAVAIMNQVNPTVIPRNHVIERMINQIYSHGNYTEMNNLLNTLYTPYKNMTDYKLDHILPPRENEKVTVTFCGT